ncbi:hypothetical protein O4H52_14775 [Sphingomonadaceae bacterium G21617-S1]|nr:hypothetical protein [Sphingomonadaceae bacterium G21617-S1]
MTTGKRKPRAKPNVQSATFVDTTDAAEAEKGYAKHVDGWEQMPERQRREIVAMSAKLAGRPRPVKVALNKSDGGSYSVGKAEGDDNSYYALKLTETFATFSLDFASDRLNELINHFAATNKRGASNLDLNSALAFVHGAKPQNEVEAALAVQMAAAHDAAMRALRAMGGAEFVPQMQMFGNLANKLMRTFAAQAETLARMRRGGEQVVRHIHVDNRGGQAVITENLHTGGRETAKNEEQSHAIGSGGASGCAALPSPDPLGWGVPIPSREREAALQDARRDEPGGADR